MEGEVRLTKVFMIYQQNFFLLFSSDRMADEVIG